MNNKSSGLNPNEAGKNYKRKNSTKRLTVQVTHEIINFKYRSFSKSQSHLSTIIKKTETSLLNTNHDFK